ncbi:MAG TPA: YggS family pyridoxal phosphate-dependent enzyme [Acidimicrobiia bacterium]|nr:YggS family pyridoxal phosphate-dependent enzyme [Acidimicrobiia bacterium]
MSSAAVAEHLAEVRARIADAARASGRRSGDITLVVVTKGVEPDRIRAAVDAGAHDLGENRAQELLAKAPALAGVEPVPRWHFIGRLQRNKVRSVAPYVALWQSVDREELAAEIGRRAPGATVLVQVNVAGEAQKGGCPPADAPGLVEACRRHGCAVDGLMTVPPARSDPRAVFDEVRELVERLGLPVCSMGMSGDYELAIAHGATMVRVGSAIFGPRREPPAARR